MRCTYGTVRIKLAKTIHVDIYGADIRFRPTLHTQDVRFEMQSYMKFYTSHPLVAYVLVGIS